MKYTPSGLVAQLALPSIENFAIQQRLRGEVVVNVEVWEQKTAHQYFKFLSRPLKLIVGRQKTGQKMSRFEWS
jgi:hypothetical protein